MKFLGYRRPDGRVGIRNHVLILPTCVCSADAARIAAGNVNGAVTFHNQNGCGQIGKDFEMTMDIEAGYAANPNVYGTVLIGLGCEEHQAHLVAQAIRKRTNKPLVSFVIQDMWAARLKRWSWPLGPPKRWCWRPPPRPVWSATCPS